MERYVAISITVYKEHALDTAFIYLGKGRMIQTTMKKGFTLLKKWEKLMDKQAQLTFNPYNSSIRDWNLSGWIKTGI